MEKERKSALVMADGYEVRGGLDELRTHFDLPKVTEYFRTGQLLTWLEERYYDSVAAEIRRMKEEEKLRQCHRRALITDLTKTADAMKRTLDDAQNSIQDISDDALAEELRKIREKHEQVMALLDSESMKENGGLEDGGLSLEERLCQVLGTGQAAMRARIAGRESEKLTRLRKKTNDDAVLAHAEQTAFNQEDLAELLDAGEKTIYLEGKEFDIPMRIGQMKYVGILGTPVVHIAAATPAEIRKQGIGLINVTVDYLEDEKENFLDTIQHAMSHDLTSDIDPSLLILHGYSGSKGSLRDSIRQAAEDAEIRLTERMARRIDRRLECLEDIQEQYDRLCEQSGAPVGKLAPDLAEVRSALFTGHDRIVREMTGKLAERLLSKARYELLHFDLLRSSEYTLDNTEDLDDASEQMQRKIILQYKKRDMEGVVQSYLRSLRRGVERLQEMDAKEDEAAQTL